MVRFDDRCPVVNKHNSTSSTFLENWMGELMTIEAFHEMTLLDLSLPGSHDTLSYDLSLTVSDGGIDGSAQLASLLHDHTHIVPNSIEDYFRKQAATQGLTITEQLLSGIRFFDLRIMYEDNLKDWYSLHMMQSNSPAINYFKEIRAFIDNHPKEIVVLWVSKHGSECATGNDQYPNTTIAQKQQYWNDIQEVFNGVLVNNAETFVNSTSIKDMITRNHRVLIYATDYVEFTDSSIFALNGCLINNQLGPGVSDEVNGKKWEEGQFSTATTTKDENKAENKFYLMSMATGVPGDQMVGAFIEKFLPGKNREANHKCVESFNIPGFNKCPETLLDIANLENYYKQITLDETYNNMLKSSNGWNFPNAIYINGVDFDGTIRTGLEVLWGKLRNPNDIEHATTSYAYVDTLIAANVINACSRANISTNDEENCKKMMLTMTNRRSVYPATYWDDKEYGRLTNWADVI